MESIGRRTEIARTFGYTKCSEPHNELISSHGDDWKDKQALSIFIFAPRRVQVLYIDCNFGTYGWGFNEPGPLPIKNPLDACHTLYFIVYTPTAANAKLKFTQDKMPLNLSTCICRRSVYSPPVICVIQMPSPATEKCRPNWKTTTPILADTDGFHRTASVAYTAHTMQIGFFVVCERAFLCVEPHFPHSFGLLLAQKSSHLSANGAGKKCWIN